LKHERLFDGDPYHENMPRRDAEFFGDQELDLIYIAKRLKDALRLEKSLTEAGVDYAVQTETYHGGFIFRSERVGAFFYVKPESVESARGVLTGLRMQPYAGD
jgi:hypothetical protein